MEMVRSMNQRKAAGYNFKGIERFRVLEEGTQIVMIVMID